MSDPKLPHRTNYCLCKRCGEYFMSDRGHLRHMKENACMAPPDMLERGFQLKPKGKFWYWVAP